MNDGPMGLKIGHLRVWLFWKGFAGFGSAGPTTVTCPEALVWSSAGEKRVLLLPDPPDNPQSAHGLVKETRNGHLNHGSVMANSWWWELPHYTVPWHESTNTASECSQHMNTNEPWPFATLKVACGEEIYKLPGLENMWVSCIFCDAHGSKCIDAGI